MSKSALTRLKLYPLTLLFIFVTGCYSLPKPEDKNIESYKQKISQYRTQLTLDSRNTDGAIATLEEARKNITAEGNLQNGKGRYFRDEAWVVASEGHLEFGRDNLPAAISKWNESFDIERNGLIGQQSVDEKNAKVGDVIQAILAGAAGAVNQQMAKASAKPGSTYTYTIPGYQATIVPTPEGLKAGSPQNTVLRTPVRLEGRPFNAIVKLRRDNYSCTATMVSRRVAISAAHCLSNDGSAIKPQAITLQRLGIFVTKEIKVVSYFTHRGENAGWDKNRSNDWVILVTETSLENNAYGVDAIYPKVSKVIPSDLILGNPKLMLAGYSADLNGGYYLTLAYGCKMKQGQRLNVGIYYTNCENAKGSSGAAVMTTFPPYNIVGIHTAQITTPTDEYYSVETFSDYFTNLVDKIILMY